MALPDADAWRLLDLAADAIFVRDAGGVITYWNAGAARLYGWAPEEAVGQVAGRLLGTRYPEGEAAVVAAAEAGGWDGELVQLARDGRRVLVESRWVADIDADGLLRGFLEVNRDITARRAAEQRVRRLLEAAPDPTVLVDEHGIIRMANRRAHGLLGYDPGALPGMAVETLVPDGVRAGHAKLREGYFTDPQPRTMGASVDLAARRADGTEVPVEISLAPVETEEGMLVAAALRDVTVRRQVQRRLEDQAAALARSNAELERFAYVASHDLQEPLRKVATFCKLLKEDYGGRLDETADMYIDYAVDGALRMRDLINDLLTFSRIGRREGAAEDVDVAAVVATALRNLDALREECDATVDVGDLPTVRAERSLLVQLYQNLLGNALKFRAPGRRCHVEVGARRQGGEWLFWVADNGIGIDDDKGEQIFEMFSRLHARTEYPGTGIGLAICRRIVERSGGRIWLDSRPGVGSTFSWTMRT
ncbi:MAG TPA: PAS domain S-box protein [Acidimicrobiales bacterium]|nr:PAS domain S-box protein [Acidimicrobiales bacterium]